MAKNDYIGHAGAHYSLHWDKKKQDAYNHDYYQKNKWRWKKLGNDIGAVFKGQGNLKTVGKDIQGMAGSFNRHLQDVGERNAAHLRWNANVAGNQAKNAATSVANSVKNTTTNAYNSAKTGVTNAYNSAKTGVTNAYNSAKTAAGNARDAVVDTYNNVKDSARQAGVKAGGFAKMRARDVSNAAKGVGNNVKRAVNDIKRSDTYKNARQKAVGLGGAAKMRARDVSNAAKGVKSAALTAYRDVGRAVNKGTEAAKNSLKNSRTYKKIQKNKIEYDKAKGRARTKAQTAKFAANYKAQQAKKKVTNAYNNAKNAVSTKVSTLKSAASQAAESAKKAAGDTLKRGGEILSNVFNYKRNKKKTNKK